MRGTVIFSFCFVFLFCRESPFSEAEQDLAPPENTYRCKLLFQTSDLTASAWLYVHPQKIVESKLRDAVVKLTFLASPASDFKILRTGDKAEAFERSGRAHDGDH